MTNLHAVSDISCPVCRSSQVSNAEYEGIIEQVILWISGIRPFLCQMCDMRFYLFLATIGVRRADKLEAWPTVGPSSPLYLRMNRPPQSP